MTLHQAGPPAPRPHAPARSPLWEWDDLPPPKMARLERWLAAVAIVALVMLGTGLALLSAPSLGDGMLGALL